MLMAQRMLSTISALAIVEMASDLNFTKPDLRVFLKWMIADSGSVITDVMLLNHVE